MYNRPNTAITFQPAVLSPPSKSTGDRGRSESERRYLGYAKTPYTNYVQQRQQAQRTQLPANPYAYPHLLAAGLSSKAQVLVPKPNPPSIPNKYGPLFRPTSGQSGQNLTLSPPATNSHLNSRTSQTSGDSLKTLRVDSLHHDVNPVAGTSYSLNIDLLTRKLNKLANQQQILDKIRTSTSTTSIPRQRGISRTASRKSSTRIPDKAQLPPIKNDVVPLVSSSKGFLRLPEPKPEHVLLVKRVDAVTREDLIKSMIERIMKHASSDKTGDGTESMLDEDEDELEDLGGKQFPRTPTGQKTPRPMSPSVTTALSVYSKEANPEIPIEVVEQDGTTEKFYCPFNLLINGMPYFQKVFGKVDPRFQKKDVDISVQCDIKVFEILLHHVKQPETSIFRKNPFDGSLELVETATMRLDHKTLISLLIASDHLGMSNFCELALDHFGNNLADIIKQVPNLHNIPDNIFVKLVEFKRNAVLATFDRLPSSKTQQRIFRLLSELLVREEANKKGLFKCKHCGKILVDAVKDDWTCSSNEIGLYGEHISNHDADPTWNLNEHLKLAFKSQFYNQDWRRLYWHIWALVTTFTDTPCVRCGKTFQAIAISTCGAHTIKAEYPTVHKGDRVLETRVGIHPCCGARSERFNVSITNLDTTCNTLDHYLDSDFLNAVDLANYDTLQAKREEIQLFQVKRPNKDRMSLLEIDNKDFLQDLTYGKSDCREKTSSASEMETVTDSTTGPQGMVISVKVNKKKTKKSVNSMQRAMRVTRNQHLWNGTRSIRWNQDSLRNSDLKRFEIITKQQRSADENAIPSAGLYQAMEQDRLKTTKQKSSKGSEIRRFRRF